MEEVVRATEVVLLASSRAANKTQAMYYFVAVFMVISMLTYVDVLVALKLTTDSAVCLVVWNDNI